LIKILNNIANIFHYINITKNSNKSKEKYPLSTCLRTVFERQKAQIGNQRPPKIKNGSTLLHVMGALVFVLFLILGQVSSYADQITLAWNASDGAAGYKIYYGTTSKNYTSVVDVGNNLTYSFADLPNGSTYYFAATAYDVSHLESDYSAEVSYNSPISGYPAILWRYSSTGQINVWYMNGTHFAGTLSIGVVSPDWAIVGRADFNSDGKPDIIWRNTTTGQNVIYYMDGTTILSGVYLPTVDPAWTITGTGDFNSDGHPDILWRNSATGQNVIYYMDGTTILSGVYLPTVNPAWTITGTGDFNSDGHPDILWRNISTGEITLWYMNGPTVTGTTSVGIIPLEWAIAGVSDFNSDGYSDILWRNTSTGIVAFSCMIGTTFIGDYYLPTVADQQWKIVG
jgi:hypothetical protein